jgi:hypothetical protein
MASSEALASQFLSADWSGIIFIPFPEFCLFDDKDILWAVIVKSKTGRSWRYRIYLMREGGEV